MLMYFSEYSNNCYVRSGSLQDYYRDEVNDCAKENNDTNSFRINEKKKETKTRISKYFENKKKLIRRTPNNDYRSDANVVVLLK